MNQLSQWTLAFVNDAATHQYLTQINASPMPYTADQLRQFIGNEIRTWAEIVNVGNIERK